MSARGLELGRHGFRIALLIGTSWLSSATPAHAQAKPSSPEVAAAIKENRFDAFDALVANDMIAIFDDVGKVSGVSKKAFFEQLRACALNNVYEAGKLDHTRSGVEMICRDKPVAGSPCEKMGYGLALNPIGDRFVVRVFVTPVYDRVACPPTNGPIYPPAPPPPASPQFPRVRTNG